MLLKRVFKNKLYIQRNFASAQSQFLKELTEELAEIQKAGTFKRERIILGYQDMEIRVEGMDKPLLNFCANNYLGLSSHNELITAGKKFLNSHGAGLSSVRFICGTQNIHKELERKIAEFHGKEDAILYGSCFDANAGIFEVITNTTDAIISDELNHASIIDGIRLSKAKRFRYKHMEMKDLEKHLKDAKSFRRRIIVTDGVFSMDGDEAPLKEIVKLAKKYDALVLVDDCHATGFVGLTGRGTEESHGVQGHVDIINSTLGKAMGGAMGGYTTGSKQLIEILRQRSRPSLFSNSLPPSVVGSSMKAFEILSKSNSYAKQLKENVHQFRSSMEKIGFKVLGSKQHPICPVFLGNAKLASEFSERILQMGIYVIGFSYPVVPKEMARIRVQLSAKHTHEQILKCINSFENIGKELGVI